MEANELKNWYNSLTVEQNQRANKMIVERFEINRTTLYVWKNSNKRFTTIEKEELNKISQVINNRNIFQL